MPHAEASAHRRAFGNLQLRGHAVYGVWIVSTATGAFVTRKIRMIFFAFITGAPRRERWLYMYPPWLCMFFGKHWNVNDISTIRQSLGSCLLSKLSLLAEPCKKVILPVAHFNIFFTMKSTCAGVHKFILWIFRRLFMWRSYLGNIKIIERSKQWLPINKSDKTAILHAWKDASVEPCSGSSTLPLWHWLKPLISGELVSSLFPLAVNYGGAWIFITPGINFVWT